VSPAHADLVLAEHANSLAVRHDAWEDAARAWAAASEPVFVAGVLLLIAIGLVARRRALLEAGVLALASAGAALGLAVVLANAVDRPRPFVAHPRIHAFLAHAADPGFPSDHATAAFAIAVVLVVRLGWAGVPVLVAALALAASRVLIGLHYPGDVLAGALIGTLCALAACAAAGQASRHPLWPRRAAQPTGSA
jgi:undecaprenyl-diphosphatase